MDWTVGKVHQVVPAGDTKSQAPGQIEARVLHVRAPRRRQDPNRKGQPRHPGSPQADPPGARVVILLIPEGYKLPEDGNLQDYRVFLRFVRK